VNRLWITGEYKLSAISQRFRIEARHLPRPVEKAAIQLDYIALEPTGTITASALALATRYSIPVIAVNPSSNQITLLNQVQWGGVEYIINQYYSKEYTTEYAEKIAKATVHNIRQLTGPTTETGNWKTDYLIALHTLQEQLKALKIEKEVEYTLLYLQAETTTAIIKAKLNPHIGYLNKGIYSLTKDLTQLFTPPVLHTLIPRILLLKQEETLDKKQLLKHLKWSLQTPVNNKPLEQHIQQEPKKLAQTLRNPTTQYKPFTWTKNTA